jgi:poly-gamma-glutamate capsule biosynthesis protein CapA/YwtB (metallophosphatase superfamily)
MKRLLIVGLILSTMIACTGEPPAPAPPTDSPPTREPSPTPSLSPNTPLPTPTYTTQPTLEPTTRIWFTGDINPGRCVALQLIEADDFTIPYQALAADLQAADLLVGSLDGSVTDRADPADCPTTMSLNGPTRIVEGFTYAGFDLMTVATNHVKNCGIVGCWNDAMLDSIDTLRQAGIAVVGGGHNLEEAGQYAIIEQNGVKFAFIGTTTVGAEMWATETEPGTNPLTHEIIAAQIADARQNADVVIVLAQWGSEYQHEPNWDQFDLAGTMMEAGADLVIGNQAHWVQGIEHFPNGLVAYGLGNFVFDQNWSLKTRQGVIFEAIFRGDQLESWQLLPIVIEKANYQPRWANEEEAAEILANIETASNQMPIITRNLETATATP